MAANRFNAADAALGYLYQIRVALLLSLKRLRLTTQFVISLEVVDDVAFEIAGQPAEILQTKHHRTRTASLTDASADLWKTLRVWISGIKDGSIGKGATLNLLTTATAASNSAASYLRVDNRDMAQALSALESVARSSQSKANEAAYIAFLGLSSHERRSLVDSIWVLDGAPQIENLNGAIEAQLFWVVQRSHLAAFRDYLEGWWFRRVILQLTDPNNRILGVEIDSQISDLREQFKQDALPIADDLLNVEPDDNLFTELADSVFVRQLELAKASEKRIVAAIRDYYRAFEQRSRWLRDDLLVVGDLSNYERKLIEEWQLTFERIKDELGSTAADAAKERAARAVLSWAETVVVPIRPQVTEPFVTRGSLHILADALQVGWHSEFRQRLAHLLASAPTAA